MMIILNVRIKSNSNLDINFLLGSTASASLIDTLMPTLRNYDDNGLLKSTTDQNERLTSFDSFMQGLDQEYDQRKQFRNKPIQRKPSETKKPTTAPPPPPSPLTLDGPIEYRDKKVKKKPLPKIKKAKAKPKKRVVLSSSSSEGEGGETDPSKMVYDEDEAWFESYEEQKRRLTDEDNDYYEPKKKKKRSSAKDDGDDQQYYSRLREFYADRKPPSHVNNNENDDVEMGPGLWMPLSIWNRLFK
jgi:hypothetical protein